MKFYTSFFFPLRKQVKSSVGLSENIFFFFWCMTVALKWVFFFSGGKISMSCGTLVAMTTIPFFCLFKWQFELALKPEQHPGLLKSNCCLTRAQHLIPLPFFSSPICRLLFEIYSQILLLNPLSQLWNAIQSVLIRKY